MKKKIILFPLVALMGYALLTSYIGGAGLSGIERTGVSGTTGCAAGGCHSSAAGITTTIELISGSSPVTVYTPGASYTIRLSGAYSASSTSTALLSKFGFQMSAMKTGSTTINAGTWGTMPGGMHTASPLGVNVVEHSGAITATTGTGAPGATTYVVNIPWTAPVAGTGPVTLRGVINAVNGNSMQDAADRWSATSLAITEASTPLGPITGTLTVCAGATTTLANATPGGTWTSGNVSVATVVSSTGVVTGVAAGTSNITYAVGTNTVTAVVTVNPSPAAVTGTQTVCVGATTTLSSTPAGGTWSSTPVATGTIGAANGIFGGVAAGTASVVYTVGGCSVGATVTVNAAGAGAISGSHTVCVGLTAALTNPTTGGTWSSSNVAKATVGASTGIVTGIATGTANITYTATNTCGTSFAVHSVNVLAASACPTSIIPTTVADEALSVYPNPATGVFTVRMQTGTNELAQVVITNIAGQRVRELYLPTNSATEVVIARTPGIYFVTVSTSRGRFVSKLLIE